MPGTKNSNAADIDPLAKQCVEICEDRKATKIVLYNMKGKSVLADYYLICNGQSEPHLNALAGHLHQRLAAAGARPKSVQGTPQSHWIIMDYGSILIHLFTPECREFYKIEQLWPEDLVAYVSKEDAKAGFLDDNWSYKG